MKEFLRSIDFDLLKEQKEYLLGLQEHSSVTGIINLIDAIQDIAVDKYGYDEKKVFGKSLK